MNNKHSSLPPLSDSFIGRQRELANVELALLSDIALLPQMIAKRLGIRETLHQPLTKTLSNYLKRKRFLLILDNCEHLRTSIGQLAETPLLPAANIKILATSREAFSLAGEITYLVPSCPCRSFPIQAGMKIAMLA